MIGITKLARLPEATRLRKILRLIQGWETALSEAGRPGFDGAYAAAVLKLLAESAPAAAGLPEAAAALEHPSDRAGLARALNGLRHSLLAALGESAADWDFAPPAAGREAERRTARFQIGVAAEDLRSPFNVGSICRTALAFGAEAVYFTPGCPRPDQPRALRSGMGAAGALAWEVASLEQALERFGGTCFALETGGTPLESFSFPERGLVILGSEELGISPAARRLAEAGGGLVGIELFGPKASLGVAVAFGILMSRWTRSAAPRAEPSL